ncbi:hypothetical protein RND71_017612 [Anisodus tanguticus]|uniref:Uncharacterized protein n=1 Tax=Anisodus tanguticus TaxID=243964 RepID=A0AAE1S2M5_9SOLA|nr:hypothetical protein RND71_017612 [Anisodus tanguticus]
MCRKKKEEVDNGDGIVRADVPFRRAESKYNVDQVGVTVEFYGVVSEEMGTSAQAIRCRRFPEVESSSSSYLTRNRSI